MCVKRLRSMKKITLLLLALAMLLSCEKMSPLGNGIYINGEPVSNLTDGYAWGFGGAFSFQDSNACKEVHIIAETAGPGKSIGDSEDLSIGRRLDKVCQYFDARTERKMKYASTRYPPLMSWRN